MECREGSMGLTNEKPIFRSTYSFLRVDLDIVRLLVYLSIN